MVQSAKLQFLALCGIPHIVGNGAACREGPCRSKMTRKGTFYGVDFTRAKPGGRTQTSIFLSLVDGNSTPQSNGAVITGPLRHRHSCKAGRARSMIPSLCDTCRNVREVRTARSRFLLCELSVADAAYPKYPPQPVERCGGYEGRQVAKAADEAPGQQA